MKKRVTIILLIIVTISIVINLYPLSFSDNKNRIEKVSTKETFTDKENMLSIMIQEENGEYKEDITRANWPDQSKYYYEKAECTDSEGTVIPSEEAVTFENNTIHIKTKNTIYCTLYFGDNKFGSLWNYLKKNDENNTLQSIVVSEMYRYKGTYDKVTNNYICFGKDDKNKCLTAPETYMYRIIGMQAENNMDLNIPSKSLKLIKATKYVSGNDVTFQWHSSLGITWDGADINLKILNGTGLGQFLNEENIDAYWQSKIISHKWYTGGYITNTTEEEPKLVGTITSKIGLAYSGDYGPAYKIWNSVNWIYLKNRWTGNKSEDEWTMSRVDNNNAGAFTTGSWYDGRLLMTNEKAVAPAFYLIPSITLTGSGTKDNPFIIGN